MSKKRRHQNQPSAQTTISPFLASAIQHHQAGHLAQAEQMYRQILQQQPNHFDAIHLLGVIAYQVGNLKAAISQYQRALALNPDFAELHSNLGNALRDQGKLDKAITHYRKALALKPQLAETHISLGNAMENQGKLDKAITHYQQALALKPQLGEAHYNLGNILGAQGKLESAVIHYQQALTLAPHAVEVHNNLGHLLRKQNKLEAAITHYQQALALRPNHAGIHNNLGYALAEQDQLDLAISHLQQALILEPNFIEALINLGNALEKQGQLWAAIAHYQRAFTFKPDSPELHNNWGTALTLQGQLGDAIAHYEKALALKPDYCEAHYNLGTTLLLAGDLRRGFAEYEWRWQVRSPERHFLKPLWDGSDLGGQTILLHAEQGFGDTIQFIRYAAVVAQHGGRVVVECQKQLVRLLSTVAGVKQLIPKGAELPEFDIHAPLMSLPYLLGTTLDTIPNQVPYISPPNLDIQLPHPVLAGLKVGIVWASGDQVALKSRTEYRKKSCSLPIFLKFLSIPGVSLYSLQVGCHANDIREFNYENRLQDLSSQINDFADTAALIAQLDLVITVDTAVAHLAGALGKSVWVLLASGSDWRWLLEREDSPWYPTMRLFRSEPKDWEGVFERVAKDLQEYLGAELI